LPSLAVLARLEAPHPIWAASLAGLAGLARVRLSLGWNWDLPPSGPDRPDWTVAWDPSLDAALKGVFAAGSQFCLCLTEPVVLPRDALTRAVGWLKDDPRLATVSFFSNAAGYLSFPVRNRESAAWPANFPLADPTALTDRLRGRGPDSGPVPIACPEGGAVLVAAGAFALAGGLAAWPAAPARVALAEFGLRASRRGLSNVLDAATFFWRAFAPGEIPGSPLDEPGWRRSLHACHGFFPGLHDAQAAAHDDEPLALAWTLARAKICGLSVLLDASVLGPREMGSQRHVLSLAQAMAAQPEISQLYLGLPDPGQLPDYAAALAGVPKIALTRAGRLDFPDAPRLDIIHRTYQPTRRPIPLDRWQRLARRTVVTVQDLIAYKNGAYHQHWRHWRAYRHNLARVLGRVDMVLAISRDVRDQLAAERLPCPDGATVVVPVGCDHAGPAGPEPTPPPAVTAAGLAERAFLLVLGADFIHKNRDLAVQIWRELTQRGLDMSLILAGAAMGAGNDRQILAPLLADQPELLALGPVCAAERDWLLSRAALVLYPSSAEGFGLVPFEAARFGRPCLAVSFGPLGEFLADPQAPTDFGLAGLVDRAQRLLTDPGESGAAVTLVRKRAAGLTWERTAQLTVDAYCASLARPSRPGAVQAGFWSRVLG